MCIMDMLDKATFAQVPLELTGDPSRPVAVRSDANGDYKVGTGTTWRLGKKMLGATVPMRFHAGEPFLIPPGVVHNARNITADVTTMMLSTYLVDETQPLVTPCD